MPSFDHTTGNPHTLYESLIPSSKMSYFTEQEDVTRHHICGDLYYEDYPLVHSYGSDSNAEEESVQGEEENNLVVEGDTNKKSDGDGTKKEDEDKSVSSEDQKSCEKNNEDRDDAEIKRYDETDEGETDQHEDN